MNSAKIFFSLVCAFGIGTSVAVAQKVHDGLRKSIEPVYNQWRNAMITKNYQLWKAYTAENQQVTIYNRIASSRQAWPGTVFKVPVAPPNLKGLKAVNVNMKGATAIATYFGKINFGVGGAPAENLMLLYFVGEQGKWKFDKAEYINLVALPEVRKQMLAGNYKYADQGDFSASGKVPDVPVQIKQRGYVAKIYVWCPGREVKVDIHKGISKHRFQNDKRAEVVIGGALDGKNPISFTTKSLPGAKGNEPLDIRVFMMSQIPGVKPTTVFQYRITPEDIKSGKKPSGKKSETFVVTAEHVKAIMTRSK